MQILALAGIMIVNVIILSKNKTISSMDKRIDAILSPKGCRTKY